MAGRPEFLSVLGRVRFSLSNGNFPSLNFKPLQVKCFESILKGQDVIGVLPTGSGKSMRFHGCTVLATIKPKKLKLGLLWDLKSPKVAQSRLKSPKIALSRLRSPFVALNHFKSFKS